MNQCQHVGRIWRILISSEVATLLGSFYNKSRGDHNKEPWSIPNLKHYLNLGYAKLDELPKFCDDYFQNLGDDWVFFEPTNFDQPPPENNILLYDHGGFH